MTNLRLDFLALAGCVFAFMAVVGGNYLEGGNLKTLINLPALVIVLGGTLGAIILQSPWDRLKQAVILTKWMVVPPSVDVELLVKRMSDWAIIARKDGLIGLEDIMDAQTNHFLKKGLSLIIDAGDISSIRRALEMEIEARTKMDLSASQVFRAMGGYAPTIGILGAVLGLVHVMENLSDPSQLGQGIATAFVATIYGVGFANLLFLPIADRLKTLAILKSDIHQVIAEGLIGIAQGEHPRTMKVRMLGVLNPT